MYAHLKFNARKRLAERRTSGKAVAGGATEVKTRLRDDEGRLHSRFRKVYDLKRACPFKFL